MLGRRLMPSDEGLLALPGGRADNVRCGSN